MRNIKLISLALLTTLGMSVFAQTGQYSTRAISADGKTSTWTFDVVSGSAQTIADGTEDNGIVYVNGGGANKAQTSKYMSFNKSEVYIEVPSGSAGSISMVVYSSSDSRWFQLFINGTSGHETQRLWSKAGDGTDGKKGPQTFTFTSTDITTSSAKTYLHLKTNGTEMKLKSFTITLTSGSYSGSTPPEPEKSHDATLKSLTYGSDQTSVPDFSADKFSYSVILPSGYVGGAPSIQAAVNDEGKADVDVEQTTTLPGTAKAVVTAEDGTTKLTYTVSFSIEGAEPPAPTPVTGVTLEPTNTTVKVGKTVTLTATIEPGNADNKNLTWSSDKTNIATVVNGVVTGKAAGTAEITVKTEDGGYEATCKVTVEQDDTPTSTVPQTDLTIHKPEIYEVPKSEGGYGGDLTIVSQREYEVYYMTRDADSKFCIATTNADKTVGITTRSSDYACTANDGWFQFSGKGWSSSSDAVGSEFGTMARRLDMDNNGVFEMHFSGYDQFAIVAKDKKRDDSSGQTKPENNRYLEVYIDDVLQPQQINTNPTIRRYDITTGEHVVRVIHIGTENSSIYGFSLRVAQEPIVRYIDGNDSSQVVKAGRELEPIYYYTKYNKFGETRLIWDGEEGTGVGLSIYNSDAVGDSIVLSGTPVCPAGEYKYRVESYTAGGVMTRSISGKFSVIYEISFNNEEDTIAEAYQGEEMDYPIVFNYYAQSADDISLEWEGDAPEGIIGKGSNGRYIITGTPTTLGTYKYTISVAGGNSLQGTLSVIELNLGEHPILYLQNRRYGYKDDGIYSYLKEEKRYNLVQRVAKDGLRPAAQYEQYDWILISEDVNADNGEVLAIARGEANRPVLNMKSFSYAPNRLDWGEPDNGSITDEGRFITVARGDHPIFKNWKHNGDKIQVLNRVNRKGLMPVEVHYNGTLCLATALMRDTNYYKDGDPATFLHEVPADMRNGYKYICMPIALNSSNELASEGKKLLEKVITYLQNDEATVEPTELEIKSFLIDTIAGVIDNMNNTITFDINRSLFDDIETFLSAVVPTVTLADPENSYLIPDPNEPIDMNWTKWIPLTVTVTDHVSQRVYTIIINLWSMEGIEEVYTAGDWVNVFDIYGRKIATTNEDVYSMALPHGMYVVVTENGQTLKIMR